MPLRYWEEGDFEEILNVENFSGLVPIALKILSRMPEGATLVSGPITTGGLSVQLNSTRFLRAIFILVSKGINVFNQMPFQEKIFQLSFKIIRTGQYPNGVLEEFYLPIFESGHIKQVLFLPRWETSVGARWERETALRLGLKMSDFPEEWFHRVR